MEKEIDDWKHRLLVNEHIKLLSKRENIKLDVEHPYSHYGLNGVIDIISFEEDSSQTKHKVYEVKPNLINLNEGIRQLKKAREFYFKKLNEEPSLFLVTYCTYNNLKICIDNFETLVTGKINIWFYKFDKNNKKIISCGLFPVDDIKILSNNNLSIGEDYFINLQEYKLWRYNQLKEYIFDIASLKEIKPIEQGTLI